LDGYVLTTFDAFSNIDIGRPQLGQIGAYSLTALPHSGQIFSIFL